MKYKKKALGAPSCRSAAMRAAARKTREGVMNRSAVLKAARPYRRVTVRRGC